MLLFAEFGRKIAHLAERIWGSWADETQILEENINNLIFFRRNYHAMKHQTKKKSPKVSPGAFGILQRKAVTLLRLRL
jgi:hypothetical protein